MSGKVVLIHNFGTQEPRWRFGNDSGDPQFHKLSGVDRYRDVHFREHFSFNWNGLYSATRSLYEREVPTDGLFFPILGPAIDFVRSLPGGRLDELVLIGTDSGDSGRASLPEGDPRLDDSIYAARLAARCWPEIASRVVPIEDPKPHLYQRARRSLSQNLELPRDTKIYVCTSPGLPSVNQAILRLLLSDRPGECSLFQVEQLGRDEDLERGDASGASVFSAEGDIFSDVLREIIKPMITAHDYAGALQMTSRLPESPDWTRHNLVAALESAQARWNLTYSAEGLGEWQAFLSRAFAGLRIGQAQIARRDEFVLWFGDIRAYLYCFVLACASGDKSFLQEHVRDERRGKAECKARKSYAAGYAILDGLKPLAELRNDLTHRLIAMSDAQYAAELKIPVSDLDSFLLNQFALLEKAAVEIATAASLDATAIAALHPSFAQINQHIIEELLPQ